MKKLLFAGVGVVFAYFASSFLIGQQLSRQTDAFVDTLISSGQFSVHRLEYTPGLLTGSLSYDLNWNPSSEFLVYLSEYLGVTDNFLSQNLPQIAGSLPVTQGPWLGDQLGIAKINFSYSLPRELREYFPQYPAQRPLIDGDVKIGFDLGLDATVSLVDYDGEVTSFEGVINPDLNIELVGNSANLKLDAANPTSWQFAIESQRIALVSGLDAIEIDQLNLSQETSRTSEGLWAPQGRFKIDQLSYDISQSVILDNIEVVNSIREQDSNVLINSSLAIGVQVPELDLDIGKIVLEQSFENVNQAALLALQELITDYVLLFPDFYIDDLSDPAGFVADFAKAVSAILRGGPSFSLNLEFSLVEDQEDFLASIRLSHPAVAVADADVISSLVERVEGEASFSISDNLLERGAEFYARNALNVTNLSQIESTAADLLSNLRDIAENLEFSTEQNRLSKSISLANAELLSNGQTIASLGDAIDSLDFAGLVDLGVLESPSGCPSSGSSGMPLNYSAEQLFAAQTMAVIAGGRVDLGECVELPGNGYLKEAPDFTLNLVGNSQRDLEFSVNSDCDSVLLVLDSNSDWHYDDDSNELDGRIYLLEASDGVYSIWVGNYEETRCEATLKVETFWG